MENLFSDIDDCYKPILAKISFKKNYKVYEIRGYKERYLSVEEYLDTIKSYLRDMINDHKTKEWKVQLNMYINFISSKDTGETRTIYVLSDNEEIRWGNETDDVINNLFEYFLNNYQKEEQLMRGENDFNFENVVSLQYSLYKIKLKGGGSYIDSPEWIRNKLATMNPKNYDGNNCFQYAITVALNHQNIENHPERISNIEPLLTNITGTAKIFLRTKRVTKTVKSQRKIWQLTRKSLNKIIRRLLLIYYSHHTIKKQ